MKNKFFSLIIFFLILSFVSSSKFCNGQTCDDNCENCSYQCDPTTCLGKDNCYCATKEVPKGLTLEETPQFVLLTMDDSFPDYLMSPIQNLDFLLKDPLIKDQNHCPLRLSAYVRHLETDYHWLKYFESNGGSINLHTLTHETHFDKTKLADWKDELETNFKSIRELGRVNSIQGARAPFLEINDDYFTQLKNMGLKFDSSMTQYKDANDLLYWPFTLNYGVPVKKMCLDVGACPTQEHPGIWEFPLSFWTKKTGEPYDIMYQSIDIKTSLEDFKTDFDKTYNANRAPRGFYHHPQYYTINYNWKELDEDKVNVFREFYRYVASKPNVLFATESMIIEWLKNPVSFEETKKLPAFQCVPQAEKPSDVCTLTTCELNDKTKVRICGREASCPLVQPALGGITWSKFKGNTDNYNLNNDHIIEPDQDKNRWLGSAKITKASDWESGLCADISIVNTGSVIALAQIVVMKICSPQVPKNDNTLWGSDQKKIVNEKVKWIKVENWNSYIYEINFEKKSGGFCLGYKDGFKFDDAFRISVEFYADQLQCTSNTCKPKCGDDVCDRNNGENEINCEVDCRPC